VQLLKVIKIAQSFAVDQLVLIEVEHLNGKMIFERAFSNLVLSTIYILDAWSLNLWKFCQFVFGQIDLLQKLKNSLGFAE